MKNTLNKQFGHPTGCCGVLVGYTMAHLYTERLAWSVEMLNVKETDHILEIGFGPGIAVQMAADIAKRGFVAGVDISKVMIRQARKRNKKSIKEKRVRLDRESVCFLPYENDRFDKVFAINSFHHWPEPQEKNLNEIMRVLKAGGTLSITEQPHWVANNEEAVNIAHGYREMLSGAGFLDVEVKNRTIGSGVCFIVQGIKPGF